MIRVAILDLYEGQANQGMRCLRQILHEWSETHGVVVQLNEFEVRLENNVPDLTYDIYISSGGPGSPLESEGSEWEAVYFHWLQSVENWNANPGNTQKKYVLFICHSFQLACRHYAVGHISRRNKTSFGVYPVHVTLEGQHDSFFQGLPDPFYVVDSRDFQVTSPNWERISDMGAKILCVEKYRPHVPFEQALMGLRFNDYMIGVQFHPEADAIGMSMYLQREDKKQTVIEDHGEEKWRSMIEQLNDPDKIMWTYKHLLPNFLNQCFGRLGDHLLVA